MMIFNDSVTKAAHVSDVTFILYFMNFQTFFMQTEMLLMYLSVFNFYYIFSEEPEPMQ